MEYALAGGSTDGGLIDPLRFDTPPAQNYVIQRRQARWLPTGATSGFSPTGVNQCRLTFTGSGWLDLSTLRIQSTVNANKTSGTLNELTLYVSPALWVDRVRVLSQGTTLEDTHYFGKAETLISRMCGPSFHENDLSQGFVKCFEMADVDDENCGHGSLPLNGTGGKATGMFTPRALGIVRQGRWWPMSYAPLTLEIWIALYANWIQDTSWPGCNPTIDNICAHCDVCTLTSKLEESWSRYLLSGKVLTFPTTQIIGQYATIPASKDCTVSIVRALTRLRCMWIVFNRNSNADPQQFAVPDTRYNSLLAHKNFCDASFSAQISIGSQLFPDSPMDNYTMYSQLKQTVGQLDSTLKTMLPMYNYLGGPGGFTSFVLGFPFMRCEGYSNGISLRAGDLMTLRLHNIPQASDMQSQLGGVGNPSNMPTDPINSAWLFLYADVIIQVGDGSVVVLD